MHPFFLRHPSQAAWLQRRTEAQKAAAPIFHRSPFALCSLSHVAVWLLRPLESTSWETRSRLHIARTVAIDAASAPHNSEHPYLERYASKPEALLAPLRHLHVLSRAKSPAETPSSR